MQNKNTPAVGQSPTGALREGIGTKISTKLVPPALAAYAAIGLNYGAQKYSERNFEQGFTLSQLLDSIDRHTRALMNGENIDADSQLPHIALLAASVAILCQNDMNGVLIVDIVPREPADYTNTVEYAARQAQVYYDDASARRDDLQNLAQSAKKGSRK